jgi:hypothetical protein
MREIVVVAEQVQPLARGPKGSRNISLEYLLPMADDARKPDSSRASGGDSSQVAPETWYECIVGMREGTVAFDLRVGENEKSKRRAGRWVRLKASVFSDGI